MNRRQLFAGAAAAVAGAALAPFARAAGKAAVPSTVFVADNFRLIADPSMAPFSFENGIIRMHSVEVDVIRVGAPYRAPLRIG